MFQTPKIQLHPLRKSNLERFILTCMMAKPLSVLLVIKTFTHGRTLNRFVDELEINFKIKFGVCYRYDETFEHGPLI